MTTPPLCIYCREPLAAQTVRAHVIPQCLGGRLCSTTICCNDCNNAISPAENDLCKALREPSAALGALDAENHPIHAEVEVGGKTYDYASGVGNERLPAPQHQAGGLVFPLPGDPDELAEVIAKHLWRQHLTPAALDDGTLRIEPDRTFHIRPHPPGRRTLNWTAELGTTPHMRVAMKMAIELLAFVRPDDARRWSVLRPARRYVRWGEDDGTLPARFDALSDGAGVFQAVEVPRLAHAVEVWTHRQNLHYRVTLFGGLHVTGSLSTRWDGPAFSIAHAFDPKQPSQSINRSTDSDGPRLGIYHPGLKEQAFERFSAWFLARTLELSEEVTSRPWQAPGAPDIATVRPAIERRFAALLRRKRQPRTAKKKSPGG